MTRAFAVAVALVGLVAVACGGSSTTPAAAGQSITTDKAAAAATTLVLSDLPSGWVAKARGNDGPSTDQDTKVAACLGVPVANVSTHTPTSSDSPEFVSPDGKETIASTVGYSASAAVAHERFVAFDGPKVPACIGSALEDALTRSLASAASGSATTIGTPTFTTRAFPNVGDETTAYRLELPLVHAGQRLTLVADLVFVRRGRAGIRLSFESTSSTPPTEEEQHYAQVVVARAATHQGIT